jgi:hypothetical protein
VKRNVDIDCHLLKWALYFLLINNLVLVEVASTFFLGPDLKISNKQPAEFIHTVLKFVPLMISTYGTHVPFPARSGIVWITIFSGTLMTGL